MNQLEIVKEEKKAVVERQLENEQKLVTTLPAGKELEGMMAWADMMAETKFYQQMTAGGGKYAILAIFGAARELDIPPMQALNGGLWIVQGRVTLSSQMMGMLIRRRGHSIKKKVGTAEICHLVGTRADNGDSFESVFTIQQATAAGLTKNPVWKSYPDVMLYNRALSILAKQLFPDAIGNAVVEGEFDGNFIPVAEEPQIDKETAMFIDKFGLLDLNSIASRFIDSISVNAGQSRAKTIAQCAKEQERFSANLKRFEEKFSPKQQVEVVEEKK